MIGAPRSIVATCLAVVAAVAVVGLLIDRAREARPVIADVAAVAAQAPEERAPKRGRAGVLDAGVDGLSFPDWSSRGWRAVGLRRDVVGGRIAVTVRYRARQGQLTYTIVAGTDHIDYGDSTQTQSRESAGQPKVELNWVGAVVGTGRIVTFKRRSRTVVMTVVDGGAKVARRMARLANYRAGGRLAY